MADNDQPDAEVGGAVRWGDLKYPRKELFVTESTVTEVARKGAVWEALTPNQAEFAALICPLVRFGFYDGQPSERSVEKPEYRTEALRSRYVLARRYAVLQLSGKSVTPAAMRAITRALDDSDAEVQRRAVEAIAAADKWEDEAIPPLLRRLEAPPKGIFPPRVYEALAKMGRKVIPPLLANFKDTKKSSQLRADSIAALTFCLIGCTYPVPTVERPAR